MPYLWALLFISALKATATNQIIINQMKKQIPARVEESTIEALKTEASKERRSFSNHVDNVLTQHVSKKEGKPGSKKEANGK